jgi:hypothetical protein
MRILIVSLCSLALVTAVHGATTEENNSKQKKHAQTAQHAQQQPTGQTRGASNAGKKTSTAASQGKKPQTSTATLEHQNRNRGSNRNQTPTAAVEGQKGKKAQTTAGNERQKASRTEAVTAANQSQKRKNQTQVETQRGKATRGAQVNRQGKATATTAAKTGRQTAAAQNMAKTKPVRPQHFSIPNQPNTAKAPPVKFQQGKQIQGSQNWQGQQYAVFRNYKEEWHDKSWWQNHHNRIVFVFGAPYYWNAGYWFPAWGYNPSAYYAWSGPIYAYNNLPPDQVIANVQSELQEQGYYHGEVDGLIGPLTRGAIADYQRDHDLYITSTIDQPTLQSLGMA